MSQATFTRPSRGDVLELTIDSLAHGGNGVARLEGYVVFVAGAVPGDRVRAVVGKSKKAYAEARAVEIVEPSPDRVPEVADHPGAPWQVLPYERQLEVKASQVDEALTRIGRLSGYELEPIVTADEQWRYRNKVEFSFGTGAEGELVCGFHAPGRWNDDRPDDRLQARVRARQRAARAGARLLQGLRRVGPARPAWLPAQPCHPRGPPDGADPGPPGDLAGQARRRRPDRGGRRRRPVVDPDRGPRREHLRRREHAAGGRAAAGRPAGRPRIPDLARGVLPDQHRHGGEALRRRAGVRGAARARARLRPLLGHRHDRAVDGDPRARGDRAGDRRGGGRRRDRERARERDPERDVLRRRRAARAARDGGADGPPGSSP